MRKNLLITLVLVAFTILVTSCATTHPNEKLIVGKWRTVSVEKVIPEGQSQDQQTSATPSGTPKAEPSGTAREGGRTGSAGSGDSRARAEEAFNRLYRAEQKSTLEINPDKTAVKDFHGTYVKATWKMKPNGKKVVAKSIKSKDKYILEILELTESKAVILEKLPVGTLKITYARE